MRSRVWLKSLLVVMLIAAVVALLNTSFSGQPQLVELTLTAWCDGEALSHDVKVKLDPGPPGDKPAKEVTVPANGASSQPVAYRLQAKPINVQLTALTSTATSKQSGKQCANPSFSENPAVMDKDKEVEVVYKPVANNPPNTPSTPSGPTSGIVGTLYTYSTSATDPDNDQVKYTFDWGDGTPSETGFGASGWTGSARHSWNTAGTYAVKAKATDSKGAESGWSSPLTVTITRPTHVTLKVEAICERGMAPPPEQGGPIQVPVKIYEGGWGDKYHVITTPGTLTFPWGTEVGIWPLQLTIPQCPPPLDVVGYFNGLIKVNGTTQETNVAFKLNADTTVQVVYTTLAPDLVVTDIRWDPPSPKVGDSVKVYVDIKNIGTADAILNGTVSLRIPGINWSESRGAGGILKVNEVVTRDFPAIQPIIFTAPGDYQVIAEVYQAYAELDKNNNTRMETITVEGLADLIVSSLSVSVSRTGPGGECKVTGVAIVKNIGNGDAGPFALGIFADRIFDSEFPLSGLKAGASASVPFITEVKEGLHLIEAIADWKNEVNESDEKNNKAAYIAMCR
jgi:hypothetical protein